MPDPHHPTSREQSRDAELGRRSVIRAGAVGLFSLGVGDLTAIRVLGGSTRDRRPSSGSAKSVIYIFLSGGLSQLDSFDLKPSAPAEIRGEFRPIATRTPGLSICEHLPKLAQRSPLWSLVRSLTHSSNDHSAGHQIMLSGRSDLPPGFDPGKPRPSDWPSIAAIAGALAAPRNNLPPAAVLPEKLVHTTGRVIPGQFAGEMGAGHDPWFIEVSPFSAQTYGAYPAYEFDHQQRPLLGGRPKSFLPPSLSNPEGLAQSRLAGRLELLACLEGDAGAPERSGVATSYEQRRQGAISLLTDRQMLRALDVVNAEPGELDRYGRHSFGWSLLMARRLVAAGVRLVQVNLGNDETWDNHGNIFPHLKEKLFPPTDQAVSALLDDLHASGELETTLVVIAGEFGRTPRISTLPQHYKLPGRDHWGKVQTVLFAGGGVQGGRVVGSSDKIGGFPNAEPQTPEGLAATIYRALGIPQEAAWHDAQGRPHYVYRDDPIAGLF
ncbi:MAG: DUF1501 domain-containing protein [Isosphaeraceae bacterium]